MTDKTITYNEFDQPVRGKDYGFIDTVTSLDAWPPQSQADGLQYGLGWSTNMRARMADNDTHPDNLALVDGGIEWVPVDPDHTEPTAEAQESARQQRGRYADVVRFAVHYNKRMEQMPGRPGYTFHPVPLVTEGAR